MSRRRSSSDISDLGNEIATVPSLSARLLLVGLFIVMVLLIALIGIVLLFEVLTPDYDFVPALLQNPGPAVNEVWSHIGLDFPDT